MGLPGVGNTVDSATIPRLPSGKLPRFSSRDNASKKQTERPAGMCAHSVETAKAAAICRTSR